MKMKKTFIIVSLFFSLLLLSNNMRAQTTPTEKWDDGDPVFAKTIGENGVTINSEASLERQIAIKMDTLSLKFTLEGVEWTYPSGYTQGDDRYLGYAVDIDNFSKTEEQILYLITDKFENKVIIYNAKTQEVVFQFSKEGLQIPVDSHSFLLNGNEKILVTYSGSHKVVQINLLKHVEWEYGEGVAGAGANQLDRPTDAVFIEETNEYLIADQGNDRVIIVDENKTIQWELGSDVLNEPADVEYLPDSSEVLITDSKNDRVIIVDRTTKQINWQVGSEPIGSSQVGLSNPVDADYLPNGHILIADAGNNRIIELDRQGSYFWEYVHPVKGLEDVDIEPDNKMLVIQHRQDQPLGTPALLGFTSGSVVSDPFQLDHNANFTHIFWQADSVVPGTSIQMQFKSADTERELANVQWSGPEPDNDTLGYDTSGDSLLTEHIGHQWYQFRALIETNNPRIVPAIKQLGVRYYYYDSAGDPAPHIYSKPIGVTQEVKENATVVWRSLTYRQILPEKIEDRTNIRFDFWITRIDGQEVTPVVREIRYSTLEDSITVNLSNKRNLIGAKKIELHARPHNRNADTGKWSPAFTPILDYWKVEYQIIEMAGSNIQFVDRNDIEVESYSGSSTLPPQNEEEVVGEARIVLDDNNTEQMQSSLECDIHCIETQDVETIQLSLKSPFQYFSTDESIPILIVDSTEQVQENDGILQVFDRNHLTVQYRDETDPEDTSADTVIVIKGTKGVLTIENSDGKEITEAILGQSLYLRVAEEDDKNLNLNGLDSLTVLLRNPTTPDSEKVKLYEIPNEEGVYNTGTFITPQGIPIRDDKDWFPNDGFIYARWGDIVQAIYEDNFTLRKSIRIPEQEEVISYLGDRPYLIEVGPNPFYEQNHANFRIRIASSAGDLELKRLFVFNLNGEKVREFNESELNLSNTSGNVIKANSYGILENWWDLHSDTGHQVSSGTYWVKFSGALTDTETGGTKTVSSFTKFVIVR